MIHKGCGVHARVAQPPSADASMKNLFNYESPEAGRFSRLERVLSCASVFAFRGGKPKDRLRCSVGRSKTAWMSCYPEEQQGRSFASHPEHDTEQNIVLGSGWHIHEGRDS